MKQMKHLWYTILLSTLCFSFTGCNTIFHYDAKYAWVFVIIFVISVLFLLLCIYSNIIRDEISNVEEFNENARQLKQRQKWKLVKTDAPYSLTKVQFGVWTVIISSVYIYLSLCKGDCAMEGMNKTALVLMGISAGTSVAASIMDKNEINDNRARHQNAPSEGFFIDILSDDNGISLHRFQNFAWTIIAITVYFYKVSLIKTGCALPELSDTLLALTGISSATYLVLKNKENDPPIKEVQENNTNGSTSANAGRPAIKASNP